MDPDRCLLVRRALRSLGYGVAADGRYDSGMIVALAAFRDAAVPPLSAFAAEPRLVEIGRQLAETEAQEREAERRRSGESGCARAADPHWEGDRCDAERLAAQRIADGERPATPEPRAAKPGKTKRRSGKSAARKAP